MKKYFIITFILLIILPFQFFGQQSINDFINGNRKTYNTKNHSKANGLHMTIQHPNNWKAKEGNRPHIVQKITSEDGRGLETILIVINPLSNKKKFKESELEDFFKPSNLKNSLPKGVNYIDAKQTKIEGLPAGILEYSIKTERAGIGFEMQTISYIFIFGSNMVQVQCAIGDLLDSKVNINQRMNEFRPLFRLIANSIIIHDKWK